jgi:hypothetical protein
MRAWVCVFLAILFFGCLSPVNNREAQVKCGAITAANINQTYPAALDKCSYGPDLADCARDYCYIYYANATGDLTVCHAIVPTIVSSDWVGDPGALFQTRVDQEDCYLLVPAIQNGNVSLAKLLIQKGADVNATDINGETALMAAASGRQTDLVQLLISDGADVNAKDNGGETALMDAVKAGQNDIVQLLIQNGADVNAKDNSGKTPLAYAEIPAYSEIINLLKQAGAKD